MLACRTQWRAGFGGITGLDYNALFLVAGALGIKMDEGLLAGIGLEEGMVLDCQAKRNEK